MAKNKKVKPWLSFESIENKLALQCRENARQWDKMSVKELKAHLDKRTEEMLNDPKVSNRLKYLLTEDLKYLDLNVVN